jgi:hypothetical protein
MGWSKEDVEYDIKSETLYASMANLVGRHNIKVLICNSRFVSYQTSTTSWSWYSYSLYHNSQGTIIFSIIATWYMTWNRANEDVMHR